MVKISIQDVEHLANLSGLSLEENEVESLRKDIENIISYIDQLGELDTEGVEPTYQVTDVENVWRNDEVIDYGISRSELIDLSYEHNEDSVKVPKVL